jgi:hypothetical protein
MSSGNDRGGLFSPEFCEKHCPICTRARAGHRLARALQRLELRLTGGGCPWGRARRRAYGVEPHQPRPSRDEDAGDDA